MEQVELFGTVISCTANREEEAVRLAGKQESVCVRFITLWEIVRLTFSVRYRKTHGPPVLLIPATKSCARVVSAFTCNTVSHVRMFQFAIRLLGVVADRRERLYLLGPSIDTLQVVQNNIRVTFPGLQVSGRSILNPRHAQQVLEAIQKSEPRLILNGVKGKAAYLWMKDNLSSFSEKVVVLHTPEVYRRMTGGHRRPNITKGMRFFGYLAFWMVFPVVRFVVRRGRCDAPASDQ